MAFHGMKRDKSKICYDALNVKKQEWYLNVAEITSTTCKRCYATFPSRAELVKHGSEKHKEFWCERCNRTSSSEALYKSVLNSVNNLNLKDYVNLPYSPYRKHSILLLINVTMPLKYGE